jgi:hypothetical protein
MGDLFEPLPASASIGPPPSLPPSRLTVGCGSQRFQECVDYLDEALAVQPLVSTAWYLRGIANMRLEVQC